MKKPAIETFLSRLNSTLRWTGLPDRVADEMSDAPSVDRKHRPLRWIPIWPIAFSCALFVLSLIWRWALNPALVSSMGAVIVAMAPVIYISGPLAARVSQLPRPTLPHDPVSFAALANRAERERRRIGLDAEPHLVRMFANAVRELEFAAIAERMIASGISYAIVAEHLRNNGPAHHRISAENS